jgi:hypothetical protein
MNLLVQFIDTMHVADGWLGPAGRQPRAALPTIADRRTFASATTATMLIEVALDVGLAHRAAKFDIS